MSDTVRTAVLENLEWRLIGPFRGGRVVAVTGDVTDPQTFYFGACAGGVWKSTDAGVTWRNVSDGYLKTAAIGAIAVSPSDPQVLYVGTGEATIRGDVSHGDGVYKSTDGGETWTNVGLRETRHIGKIRIHPTNPDIVYVAALGHAWGPNEERGVFRSTNGGQTWQKVLYKSERAGAIDLSMDPHNPRILYASIWQAQRYPHALVSGGDDSGLWKSTDGGDSWTELTRNPGLPQGVIGKIGVAVSPAQSGRVWALVEAEDGAVFRSDDGGATWQRLSEEKYLRTRAWYYMAIIADPQDANTCWVMNFSPWRSIDGGKTFQQVQGPHGDNHDLWIDPNNSRRMIKGNDGGACVSVNGGKSWSTLYNQPTAQLYHATTDDRFPYRVYGSQQDNTAISVPSATPEGIIHLRDYFEPGGGESGYIAINPADPDLIIASGPISLRAYNDRMLLYNHRTKQKRNITVWPELHGWSQGAEALKYRFQWTFPILFSRHDPTALYVAGNRVFRSHDLGTTWDVMGGDLTRNDPDKLRASGGPITRDNTGAEVYCTIFALAESPQQAGRFWAGSDDGLLHRTDDWGQTWTNITPPASQLPEWALISIIEPSPHDPDTAYVAATRYKLDDTKPYLLKTTDAGQSWTVISDSLPADDFTRVIRADPAREGLLYAGTETGIAVSFNDGQTWERLGGNLPIVPIHDFILKGTDLVVATHGRAFWILDDLTPLHQVFDQRAAGDAAAPILFAPRPTVRFRVQAERPGNLDAGQHGYGMNSTVVYSFHEERRANGQQVRVYDDVGANPPAGALLFYYLPADHDGTVTLRILDDRGTVVREYNSASDTDLLAQPGFHRFAWDLRQAGPTAITENSEWELWGPTAGPLVLPGNYQVELTAGGQTLSQPLTVVPDPRQEADQAEIQAQFDLLVQIRDNLAATNRLINQTRTLSGQVAAIQERFQQEAAIASAAEAYQNELHTILSALIDTRSRSPQLFAYGIHEKFNALFESVDSADAVPPANAVAMYQELSMKLEEQTQWFREALSDQGEGLNRAIEATGIAPVSMPAD